MYTAVAIVIVWIPITALVAYVSAKLIKRAINIADGEIDQIRDRWCDGRVPQERLSATPRDRAAARVVWRAWAVEVKVWAALWAAVAKWAAVMAADAAAEVELAREIGEEIKR